MLPYQDKNLSIEERTEDLISRMTLEEKLGQMTLYRWDVHKMVDILEDSDDTIARGCVFFGDYELEKFNRLQELVMSKTRLGIPVLMASEGIRGVVMGTVFPQCAGIGGSFNRESVSKMAEIIGKEARIQGKRQLYAPCIDIPRELRWGRCQESYGEDPYLVGEMGAEFVKSLQNHEVAATLKHFIGYGVCEGGLNLSPAHIGEREIREVMLEPFEKGIKAGAWSLMPAYNEIDGVPVHASKRYMREILRDELGFDGMVITDYGAIEMMTEFQGIAEGKKEAGKMAIEAGVDMEAHAVFGYGDEFKEAVKSGEIDEKLVDEAVRRILTLKFRAGIFENPYAFADKASEVHSKEAVELALKIDEESILLLENDGILPLDENKAGVVAVIGNNAQRSNLGDYIRYTDDCISFYDGMVHRLGEDRVIYAQGCNPITTTDEMIQEAVETAKKADTVFLVLGDNAGQGGGVPGEEGEIKKEITCSEGYDTHDLNFTPSQRRLFDAIAPLGKKIILVLYAGRPYTIKDDLKYVNAFMYSWGGGEQSGTAFANLIFGDKSPSAKLSFSFPQSTGHLPCYYNYKVSARGRWYKMPGTVENSGRDYTMTSPDAWYPFGYGLSYTKVEYSDLKAEVMKDGKVKVNVTVENKGDYEIGESVLLFVRAMRTPVTPFIKRLRNFDKVYLKPGDKKNVEFILGDEDFTYIDFNYKKAKSKGVHKIMIDNLECEIVL